MTTAAWFPAPPSLEHSASDEDDDEELMVGAGGGADGYGRFSGLVVARHSYFVESTQFLPFCRDSAVQRATEGDSRTAVRLNGC